MGLIAMSERDLQRIEILSKVFDGRMPLVSAAHVLDLSERQVRRLLEHDCAEADFVVRTGSACEPVPLLHPAIDHVAVAPPLRTRRT